MSVAIESAAAPIVTSTAPLPSVTLPAGYVAWVRDLLHPDTACKRFVGYREALDAIARKREALRLVDIRGPLGKTAGWSPSRNFRQDGEYPYVASLLLKMAFGRDALSNRRKRHLILDLHPEFRVGYKL